MIMESLKKVNDAGTISMFSPIIDDVTSAYSTPNDEDIADQMIDKIIKMTASGHGGQLWGDIIFRENNKGDKLSVLGAALLKNVMVNKLCE